MTALANANAKSQSKVCSSTMTSKPPIHHRENAIQLLAGEDSILAREALGQSIQERKGEATHLRTSTAKTPLGLAKAYVGSIGRLMSDAKGQSLALDLVQLALAKIENDPAVSRGDLNALAALSLSLLCDWASIENLRRARAGGAPDRVLYSAKKDPLIVALLSAAKSGGIVRLSWEARAQDLRPSLYFEIDHRSTSGVALGKPLDVLTLRVARELRRHQKGQVNDSLLDEFRPGQAQGRDAVVSERLQEGTAIIKQMIRKEATARKSGLSFMLQGVDLSVAVEFSDQFAHPVVLLAEEGDSEAIARETICPDEVRCFVGDFFGELYATHVRRESSHATSVSDAVTEGPRGMGGSGAMPPQRGEGTTINVHVEANAQAGSVATSTAEGSHPDINELARILRELPAHPAEDGPTEEAGRLIEEIVELLDEMAPIAEKLDQHSEEELTNEQKGLIGTLTGKVGTSVKWVTDASKFGKAIEYFTDHKTHEKLQQLLEFLQKLA